MSADHHGVTFETDDGFKFASCECGWYSMPCIAVDDAADAYGDHRAEIAASAAVIAYIEKART